MLLLSWTLLRARSNSNLTHPVFKITQNREGPCRITDEDGPKFHPESWNTNANIFFVDQPVGVGFSYAEFGETVVCNSSLSLS